MSASLGATTYNTVTWTSGDIITEAKLDAMIANEQAYDSHSAQGLLVNNSKSFAGKNASGAALNIALVNSVDQLELGDASLEGVLLNTYLTFKGQTTPQSASTGQVNIFADSADLDAFKSIDESGDVRYIGVPIGGIIMWSGAISAIPTGWALCNGGNGTPNLTAKFIVGASVDSGATNPTNYNVGDAGGENTHVLTTSEMPSHTHSYVDRYTDGNRVSGTHAWSSANDKNPNYTDEAKTTGSQGSGSAHENRPPYYALAFIMRVS